MMRFSFRRKVVFITSEGFAHAGARVRCYGFAKELKKYSIDTQVYSFADTLGASVEEEKQMPIIRKLDFNLKAVKELLRDNSGSIFYVHRLNYHALAPFLVSMIKRNKIIFDCDDWNMRENTRYHFGIFPSSKAESLSRRLAKHSVFCVAASFFLRDYFAPFSRCIYYVPTGVDTELFFPKQKPDINKQDIVLGWMGTINDESMCRNLRFLFDVFSQLKHSSRKIFLSIAATGPYFDKIKREAAQHSNKDKIILHEWMEPRLIPAFLEGIDIGLLPLVDNTRFNAAKSPTKLFEYMAMAKPSVVSRIGEAKSIIRDGYNGFHAGSLEEFSHKLNILIDDAKLRVTFGAEARNDVEKHYSLSVLVNRLAHALETAF